MSTTFRSVYRLLAHSCISFAVLVGSEAFGPASAQHGGVTVRVDGKPEVAIASDKYNCPIDRGTNVADTPSRAYRDASGTIHFFGVNDHGMAFAGPNFETLKQNCNPVYKSHVNPDPSRFQHYEWVQPYAIEGNQIFGLIHNEFQGWRVPSVASQCPKPRNANGKELSCWYVSIQRGSSTDGGYTFTSPEPPANFLFGIPYRFAPDMVRAGIGSRTMIKSPTDGMYYVFLGGNPYRAAKARGSCLARSKDLKDWHFWTGTDFTGAFVNPYTTEASAIAPENHACPQVFINDIMSVVYHERLKVFVALTRKTIEGNMTFQYTTSSDLIRWSAPKELFASTNDPGHRMLYPSFIDTDSPAQNFDITDGKLYLYYINWPDRKRNGDIDKRKRNVMRVPVVIE